MSGESELLRRLEPTVRPAGAPAPRVQPTKPVEQRSFEELLVQAAGAAGASGPAEPATLKLSAHAQQRLSERGVQLTPEQQKALASAADEAQSKGAKDSLMLMNRLALIVNIPNRTVLTVLPEGRMRSGVVTNIDSTILVDDPTPTAPDVRN
jgi:flagellar operon protein